MVRRGPIGMASTMQGAVETYFTRLSQLRSTGGTTAETSYYGALEALLNEIGGTLKPKVFCVPQLADQGADHPDFGLYTANQCQRGTPRAGQKPERGVIEVKGLADQTWLTAETQQISKYWSAYRLVLVTNYRDFLLLGENTQGAATKLETFRLTNTAQEFWSRLLTPRKYAQEVGQSFGEYLKRVLTQSVSLREPRDVAWFLASYARDALSRVEEKGDIPALAAVRAGLEEALGVHFEGDKGGHFFRSTLVQTLFYGVFSAWVLWARQSPPPRGAFDWRTALWHLRVPMLQTLFQQVSDPRSLEALGLVELLDWAGGALNRVDRTEFFARFRDAEAVQYFYEPFLEAFDPELRKELGVWYTPPEVVRYMVARVDRALRDDLGIADGLAAENVYVLDPCTGTGSFLAEVLRWIAKHLEDNGMGGLKGAMVKKAAVERVFGFEIMPAPFVVAHLQIGLVLQSLGAALAADGTERAGVYLTNALTGWEPTDKEKQIVAWPEMEEERHRANDVKREKPILVILGNPPYNGYAGMAVEEERELSNAYRTARKVRAPEGQGLNDLYIRFYRMAERRIAEKSGEGIVCFISNNSWLDGLSFTGMRERYLDAFDAIRIDCLNGDAFKTGKTAPDGSPDPSIFSTEHNREGIRVGTAITMLARKKEHAPTMEVEFRNLWGKDKREELLATAGHAPEVLYEKIGPNVDLGLPFIATTITSDYFAWPKLPDLLPTSFPGVKTSRDDFLVDIDKDRLERRINDYFDPDISDPEIARRHPAAMKSGARFDAAKVRKELLRRGILIDNFVRYAYRPFDVRWLYWEPETKLLDEKRAEYREHVFSSNIWLVSQQKARRDWFSPQVGGQLGCLDLMDRGASCFPAYLRNEFDSTQDQLWVKPNLSQSVEDHLRSNALKVDDLFHHIVAIMHSAAYRAENVGALRLDWPRIPLAGDWEAFRASAELGRSVAALLDPEKPVPGVTSGGLRAELRVLGVPRRADGRDLAAADFDLTAGWGYRQTGAIMPGGGKTVERDHTPDEIAAFAAGSARLNLSPTQITNALGATTVDVYLNDEAFWSNIPTNVWNYKLGGYQVVKKWLSYRERDILERSLKLEEVQEVANIVRRIAAILLLGPALDANYAAVKRNVGAIGSPMTFPEN
jgi:hypothetical protein